MITTHSSTPPLSPEDNSNYRSAVMIICTVHIVHAASCREIFSHAVEKFNHPSYRIEKTVQLRTPCFTPYFAVCGVVNVAVKIYPQH